ncbi:hypothetical protein P7C70_g7010, partial [Phenoliferia sp. Uapishka_3]
MPETLPLSTEVAQDVGEDGTVVARYTNSISDRISGMPSKNGPYNDCISPCPPEATFCFDFQAMKLASLLSEFRANWRSQLIRLSAPITTVTNHKSYTDALYYLKSRQALPRGWIRLNKDVRHYMGDISAKVVCEYWKYFVGGVAMSIRLLLEYEMVQRLLTELQTVEVSWNRLSAAAKSWDWTNGLFLRRAFNLIAGSVTNVPSPAPPSTASSLSPRSLLVQYQSTPLSTPAPPYAPESTPSTTFNDLSTPPRISSAAPSPPEYSLIFPTRLQLPSNLLHHSPATGSAVNVGHTTAETVAPESTSLEGFSDEEEFVEITAAL